MAVGRWGEFAGRLIRGQRGIRRMRGSGGRRLWRGRDKGQAAGRDAGFQCVLAGH